MGRGFDALLWNHYNRRRWYYKSYYGYLAYRQKGRIHYRKEGSVWKVDDFLARAQELLEKKMQVSLNKRTQVF